MLSVGDPEPAQIVQLIVEFWSRDAIFSRGNSEKWQENILQVWMKN